MLAKKQMAKMFGPRCKEFNGACYGCQMYLARDYAIWFQQELDWLEREEKESKQSLKEKK